MVHYPSLYRNENYNANCVTGDRDRLYDRLKKSISGAKKIDIIVAFLMESGVRLLADDLKEAVGRGTAVRILCGNYLNITQPQALYLLKGVLGDRVDLRFYNVPNRSFHPKAYIFEYDEGGDIFVGSSNISFSALTSGIEWNYRINLQTDREDYLYFKKTFEELFLNHSIVVDDNEMRRYSKNWKRPKLFEDLEKFEDGTHKESEPSSLKAAQTQATYKIDTDESDSNKIVELIHPRGAQIEALYELNKSRLEDWDKGIVVAATGVGKTYLAAFDSKNFNKVLFVAHREEILLQAETTFKRVRPDSTTGFFCGSRKDKDTDTLFATVQTLGREEYLNDVYFSKEAFDYIVIDEFHHAAAGSYRNIIDYFKPKFMLGLTATPERLDSQDVFALCDYNLVYEARLKEAVNKGWVVPFRYYGVFDETDYSKVDYRNGKYDEKQLEKMLSISRRADLILQHYQKYNSCRALGFCSTRMHAVYMAKYFIKNGVKACAVISGNAPASCNDSEEIETVSCVLERKDAVAKLKEAEIRVIFSVDMFNEGLDIPEVDMVMFLRPTESPTVFLQQLGRGLRRKGNKKYVNVLDFIGNYRKANLIPFFLSGDIKDMEKRSKTLCMPDEEEYPEGCFVNFDFWLVNLFKRMADEQKSLSDKVKDEYYRIKAELGARPLRLQMYTYMDEELYSAIRSRRELNIFKDYFSFLHSMGELTDNEKGLINSKAHKFFVEMEITSMTKTYKMPVLLAFYNNGDIRLAIDEQGIYDSFLDFYSHSSNAIDLLRHTGTKDFREWGLNEYVNLARRNPMRFLLRSSQDYFYEDNNMFCLNPELEEYINNPAFAEHFKDIIDYRTRRFYKERLENRLKEFE